MIVLTRWSWIGWFKVGPSSSWRTWVTYISSNSNKSYPKWNNTAQIDIIYLIFIVKVGPSSSWRTWVTYISFNSNKSYPKWNNIAQIDIINLILILLWTFVRYFTQSLEIFSLTLGKTSSIGGPLISSAIISFNWVLYEWFF